jgi:DNA polymerase-3 subunit beta
MIISIDKKELAEAVADVYRFSERRSTTLPVLSGIVILAGDDGIKLRATNLETGIDRKINGTIKDPGVVAVPGTTFREITSSFTGSGQLTLEHGGDTVVISSGTGRSTIKTLPYEDFPIIPFPEASVANFSISGSVLKNLISTVAPCASPSTVRPELGSVLITAEGGSIKAVATDSFRLAEKKISLPTITKPFSFLIPAKNALEIMQILPDEMIEVRSDDHQCAFSCPSLIVTTRLVTTAYPDYEQIIPKSFVTDGTLLRKDFDAALKRSAIFSDSFQKVRLGFLTGDKKICIKAQNSDVGDSSESIPTSITGDEIELSFNHRYLSAPLSLITTESITLSASGIGRPLVIKGVGDATFLYLVMPMNQ